MLSDRMCWAGAGNMCRAGEIPWPPRSDRTTPTGFCWRFCSLWGQPEIQGSDEELFGPVLGDRNDKGSGRGQLGTKSWWARTQRAPSRGLASSPRSPQNSVRQQEKDVQGNHTVASEANLQTVPALLNNKHGTNEVKI